MHINAFNFPVWGMLERWRSIGWLAFLPCQTATVTCFLTEAVVPPSTKRHPPSWRLAIGVWFCEETFLTTFDERDVVTFTVPLHGIALKQHPRISQHAVPFNMEADSLNSAILGPDAVPGTPEFDLFVKEVRKEMTVKCGQKCTAVRRVFVPAAVQEEFQAALMAQLHKTQVGDPQKEGCAWGRWLESPSSRRVDQVGALEQEAEWLFGQDKKADVLADNPERGAFLPPCC